MNYARGQPKIVEGHQSKEHPLYRIWSAMKYRCYNPSCKDYPYYGGRGIEVCEEWKESFEAFVKSMGARPEGHQLDRKDNDGNYEPGNCRWVTKEVQMENRGLRSDNGLGVPNVQFRKDTSTYRVDIKRKGRKLSKTFKTIEEAIQARDTFLMENV